MQQATQMQEPYDLLYRGGWGGGWGGGWRGRRGGYRGGGWGSPWGGYGWRNPYRTRMEYVRGFGCCCPIILFGMLCGGGALLASSVVALRWGRSRAGR